MAYSEGITKVLNGVFVEVPEALGGLKIRQPHIAQKMLIKVIASP